MSGLNDLDAGNPSPIHEDGSPALAALKAPEPERLAKLQKWISSPNIALEENENGAPEISDDDLIALGVRVVREYDIDENSRSEWLERSREVMDLAMQVVKQKQYPWPKAANVIFPVMTTAAIQFAARAYPAIIANKDVVKGVVVGSDEGVPNPQAVAALAQQAAQAAHGGQGPQQAPPLDPQNPKLWLVGSDGVPQMPGYKQERGDRIAAHMSYQLLDEQPEWEPETDTLLHVLPIIGCAFRKTFFDAAKGRNASLLVQAERLVINYKARSIETTPRATEIIEHYPLEIKEMELAGVFREIDYPSTGEDGDEDAPVTFLEQHRWYDLDDDGYPEPYIVTVHKESSKVVRMVARYEMEGIKYNFSKGKIVKIDPVQYYTQYNFLPNTEGGIYGLGFGQLLKSLNESINTTLNMMLDAGHLQVVGGGFIGKGLSMNAGAVRFQPGEWKPVNAAGQSVRESLVPLPAPGPNAVLFQLLGMLIEAAKEVAGVKDVLTGETVAGNTPATTMLSMIEQGLKTFTAIYKRVHRSLKSELAKLYRLNRLYLDQETSYKDGEEWKTITRADYEKGSGVEPISDPTMVTDMQRLARAQFLMQFAGDPSMDGKKIKRRLLQGANIDNIDELFLANPPPNPEILKTMLDLQLKKQEADMKQAHGEASLELRSRHDAALIEREQAGALLARAQAIKALADSDAAVGQTDVAWAAHALEVLKAQMDAIANAGLADTSAETAPQTITPGTPEAASAQAPQQ